MKASMVWMVLLGTGLVAAGLPASAEPQVKETIAYYDVSGTTAREVRNDLNRLGPFDRDGRQFDAVTKWYVNWRYRYDRTGQGCGIASATTEAKINIIMPRLVPDAAVPAELSRSFETYSAALLVHERGHGQFGIDAAKRIEAGLVKLPAEPNCERMGQVANEFGHKVIQEMSQQDVEYDAKTNHGETQGARFP